MKSVIAVARLGSRSTVSHIIDLWVCVHWGGGESQALPGHRKYDQSLVSEEEHWGMQKVPLSPGWTHSLKWKLREACEVSREPAGWEKTENVSSSVVSDPLPSHGPSPTRLLCPWHSPGKNTRVGCHFLLQGIFPTQGSNLGLLHCRQVLHPLSQEGSPVEWESVFTEHCDMLLIVDFLCVIFNF